MKTEKILYNSDIIEYTEKNKDLILQSLNDYEIEPTENNILTEAYSFINNDFEYLTELLINFDYKNSFKKIVVFASLGLWYGRRTAKKEFNSLKEAVLYCCEDINKVYFKNKNSTLLLDALHHDGCNVFKFYRIENGRKKAIKYNDIAII